MIKIFILLIAITGFFSCNTNKINNINKATAYTDKIESHLLFNLEIEQNGSIVYPTDGIVKLQKNKFTLRFVLGKNKTIYANFSRSSDLFDTANKSKPIENIIGFGGTGLAESKGNPEIEIVLVDNAWHVWPAPEVESDRFNRFDKISKSVNGMLCERTVENVYDISTDQYIAFSDLSTIYFVYCDVSALGYLEYEINEAEAIKLVFD